MSERRPLALFIYCALLAAFTVFAACYGAYTLLISAAVAPTMADLVLAFFPIGILSAALAGLWFMRWWAVALFWFCILAMSATMLLAPLPAPGMSFSVMALNAAIWIAFALPPTLIAVIYRRQFR